MLKSFISIHNIMTKSINIDFDIQNGAKAKDVEWLGTDFAVDDLGKFRFNICVTPSAIVEYTVNSGDDWMNINAGDALSNNGAHGFDIYVRAGDLINFRTPTTGGTTVVLGRLDSVKDEG